MSVNLKWMCSNDNGSSGWFYDPVQEPNYPDKHHAQTKHCFIEIPWALGEKIQKALDYSLEVEIVTKERHVVPKPE